MKRGWALRARRLLRRLLHLGDSPERTALAFAVGVFLGFSPLIGLHTLLGLAVAFVFRLNRLAVLFGVYVNTPWTLPAVASLGTALGFYVLGAESAEPDLPGESMFSPDFWQRMMDDPGRLLLPFMLGNTLIAVVASLLSFLVVRRVLERYRARKRRRQAAPVPS